MLRAQAPAINASLVGLGPLAKDSIPAFKTLGSVAQRGESVFPQIHGVVSQLSKLGKPLLPVAADIAAIASSFDNAGGIEDVMRFIYYYTGTVNGEDAVSHYIRASFEVGGCSARSSSRGPGVRLDVRHDDDPRLHSAGHRLRGARRARRRRPPRQFRRAYERGQGPPQLPPAIVTRRGRQDPFRNPILIGAITILIVVVAVYLAYNANNGLPFVPTYNLDVDVPNASGLIASDSVLIGGTRVGYVGSISTAQTSDGTLYAVVHVKLDKSIEPLPADSTDLVRPVSPLGLEYLQIERGHSKQTLGPGATVPMTQTQLPVQVDDIFKMFNAPHEGRAEGEPGRVRRRLREPGHGPQRCVQPAAAACRPSARGDVAT